MGYRYGGRQKGVPNKATREKALRAERAVAEAKAQGKKRAVDVMEMIMNDYMNMAEACKSNELLFDAEFVKWAELALNAAKDLANYQSPKLRSVFIAPQKPPEDPKRVLSLEELRQRLENMGVKVGNLLHPAPNILELSPNRNG